MNRNYALIAIALLVVAGCSDRIMEEEMRQEIQRIMERDAQWAKQESFTVKDVADLLTESEKKRTIYPTAPVITSETVRKDYIQKGLIRVTYVGVTKTIAISKEEFWRISADLSRVGEVTPPPEIQIEREESGVKN
ncbi:MAG: hypothetical protein P8M20_02710 [Planctomycetaceae bacterium]|nr:hypothetical protein [Planctomycetaceae bacterium]